jgi:sec-independent protein translocase protein TatC
MGVFFCWLVLPSAYGWFAGFFLTFDGAILNQDPEKIVTFSLKMMAAFGICFQLPIIVYALGRLGIVTPDTMVQYWRQAAVFIFFVAAAITPSNDPISMLMMAVPLCILFAISVYAVKLTTRKKELPPGDDDDDDYPSLD